MASSAGERLTVFWLAAVGAAILAGALWLRSWGEPYLIVTSVAIVASGAFGLVRSRRPAVLVATLALTWLGVDGWRAESAFRGVERDSDGLERAREHDADEALSRALTGDFRVLSAAANRALDIPAALDTRFTALEAVLPSRDMGEVSAIVMEGERPTTWIGPVRLAVDSMMAPTGVAWGEFYSVAYATASRGTRRAVVMRVLDASPPADRLAQGMSAIIAERAGILGFDLSSDSVSSAVRIAPSDAPALWVRSVAMGGALVRLRVEEETRLRGTVALGVILLAALAVAWRRPTPAWQRFAMLGVGLGAVRLLPLSSLSNQSALFDPSYFYTPTGGAFTASVGALALTGVVAVLGVFALRRVRARTRMQLVAPALVLVVASFGPFLLRDLARGITPPLRGVPLTMWIAWEVALCLAATALLLAVAQAGRLVRRGRGGIPALAAPLIAAASALAAPVLWSAPGRWPGWYPLPWIAAVIALAVARRARGFVLHASFVAACGAVTLVWGAVARQRVALAERDVQGLAAPDAETQRLLERFARDLQGGAPPRSRVDLLRLYIASDLAASGNPMELATWHVGGDAPDAELLVADFERRPEGERDVVADVVTAGRAVVREVASNQGVQLVLGAPLDSGRVITVVVSPRTRLIADDPFAALIGLEVPTIVEPPYRLAVTSLSRDASLESAPQWQRIGDELHGDWRIGGARGFVRAHVEVELRSLDALVQRGALLVLLDLAIVALLWTLAAAADGALWRWARVRLRRWRASYRTRLTAALFAAFVLPAAAFAAWTYRRLQDEDRLSRELLLRETLRAVAATSDLGRLSEEGKRLDTPLFLYSGGKLTRSSDELYDALVPLGRYLDPVAAQTVALGDEVAANRRITVGGVTTLVGYRVLMDTRSARIILAAPARRSEQTLERQRSDLGVLVAFATVLGALAALWLSGLVARGLSAPIGALRDAALDVAGGEQSLPSLGSLPPYEFRPVYTAFRRMATDLGASRTALEQAQRRTEAVLRNVASGVIACDPNGTVTLANGPAERILGRAVAPGESLRTLGGDALYLPLLAFARDPERGDDQDFALEHRGRQLRARLTRLTRGGGGVVLTLDDVTDLARAQRVFAWGEMARQVAHEIKNPLTPIRLGVQHLRRAHADRRDDFDAILERNVTRILDEIDRLDEIARSFSKFGTAPGERAPGASTDVAAVVRDVVALERLGDSGVEWVCDANDAPVFAISRADELREVLLNILENARHANATRVAASVSNGDGPDGRVVIEVTDNGDGIDGDVMPRVFEPHFSTRTSGSGLGLAISKRLVDSWGGAIHLAPATPRGTIVRVTLVPAPPP